MRRFGVLALAAFAAIAVAGAALDWDGSHYLFHLLDDGRPLLPHARGGTAPIQWPVLGLSRITTDLAPVRLLFSALYELFPLLGLGLSWLAVRRSAPALMLWPALGIAVTQLPVQMLGMAELNLAVDLAWPLLMLALTGTRGRRMLPALALAVWIATLHPLGGALLLGIGLAAALQASGSGEGALRWTGPALLLVIGVVRLVIPTDAYDAAASTPAFVAAQLSNAVTSVGGVAAGAALLTGSIAVALLAGRIAASRRTTLLLVLPLLLACGVLLPWAVDGSRWSNAIYLREPMFILGLPVAALAVVDALLLRRIDDEAVARRARARGPAIEVAGLLLLVVLGAQAISLSSARDSLYRHLDGAGPCLSPADAGVTGTPLDSWALGSYAIDLQGRSPRTLILDPSGCALFREGTLQIAYFETVPVEGGWFDFSAARDRLSVGLLRDPRTVRS